MVVKWSFINDVKTSEDAATSPLLKYLNFALRVLVRC